MSGAGDIRSFAKLTKIPFFVKKIVVALLLMAGTCPGRAQVTVKKDVTIYFSQLPTPPATLADAYQNCHCPGASGSVQSNGPAVAPAVQAAVTADAKAMGTLTNTENQQLDQARVLHNQAQADNFNGMNKNQQLTWVQNNMQSYGNTAQAAALAQKLQDPAEVAKFKAMTPDQKLAYLKANGIDPMHAAAAPPPQAGTAVANAEAAQAKMTQDLSGAEAGQYTGMMEALLTSSSGDAQQKLAAMNNAYNSLLAFYRHADSPFALALIAANYGYTGDAGQDKAVTQLSSGQVMILTQVTQLEGYLNRIYRFGASQQAATLHEGH